MLHALLAYAETADRTDLNAQIVLASAAWAALTCAVAAVPLFVARARRPRRTDALAALVVLWGAVAVGSVVATTSARMRWSREYALRLQSGYYDPQDAGADAPALPWRTWEALALGYAALLVWSSAGRGVADGATAPAPRVDAARSTAPRADGPNGSPS